MPRYEGVRRPQALSEPSDHGAPLTGLLLSVLRTTDVCYSPSSSVVRWGERGETGSAPARWGGRRVLKAAQPLSAAVLSHQAGFEEVLDVDEADGTAVRIHHGEFVNLVLFEDAECFGGKTIFGDRLRRSRHHVCD